MIYEVPNVGLYSFNLTTGPFGSLGLHPSSLIHAFTQYQVRLATTDWDDTLYDITTTDLYNHVTPAIFDAPGIYVYRTRHIDDLEWESEWSLELTIELQVAVVANLLDEECPGNPGYIEEVCNGEIQITETDLTPITYTEEDCGIPINA